MKRIELFCIAVAVVIAVCCSFTSRGSQHYSVEKMIESGLTPQMVVQYKTVDQLAGIAQASAQMFEHIHLGQVTVYGNENTAGNFMAKTAENLSPALDLLRSIPFADTVKDMFGKKQVEATEFEEMK